MAKLPAIKKLTKEDFKNVDEKFIDALNQILEAQYTAINRGLTFKDNLSGDVLTVTIEKGRTINTSNPLKVSWSLKPAPTAVWIGSITKSNSATTGATNAPAIEWYYDSANKQICINKVYGITNPDTTNTYSLTILAITG